ncbi:MAG: hypothetical protein KGD63_05770 [Candidatus Lokiarchaeota archaeon]|nr:hypothetical protein [Candidatus Lokiarchaeota archaeon]
MIYKIYLIDGDNGISLLNTTFKKFKKPEIEKIVFEDFFNAINTTIDNIHKAISEDKETNKIIKLIETISSTILLFYHPISRILICSISDEEDNIEKLKESIYKIMNRFWQKYKSELELYRSTTDKTKFQIFKVDIEILTMGGEIAVEYPKLIIIKNVLNNIRSMGIINDLDYLVAMNCSGTNSPLEISRMLEKTKFEIHEVLNKLESLKIIKK